MKAMMDNASKNSYNWLIVTLGLLLCTAFIHVFNIESELKLFLLFMIATGGYVCYQFLPKDIKLPFLFGLNILAIFSLLGWQAGIATTVIGLLLFLIASLQISAWSRAALMLGVGSVLALGKVGMINFPWLNTAATVLGGLFMFRAMIYLYESHYGKVGKDRWININYFFLLPNLIFVIFPVVDYKTFQRNYQVTPQLGLHQKGLLWIMRGLFHLFLYRLIYYYLVPAPSEITDIYDVLIYMATSYMLIVRLSGIFHLSAGIICLFGFNLPPTFDNYFLATSFSDLWRRINIYWKDFMMKVFYFPIFFLFKKRDNRAIFITVLVVFFINWLLHQYQWFWVNGNFPLRLVDGIFWMVFGLLVALNSIWQKQNSKKKKKGIAAFSFPSAAVNTLKIMGMFAFMSVIWSFWISPSISAWQQLLQRGLPVKANQALLIAVASIAIWGIGVLAHFVHYRLQKAKAIPGENTLSVLYAAGGSLLLLLGIPQVYNTIEKQYAVDLSPVIETKLNALDEQLLFEGYYESVLAGNNLNSRMWEVNTHKNKHEDEANNLIETPIYELTNDLIGKALKPSAQIKFKGKQLSTNSFALRDRAYSLKKPPKTIRIALLGGSSEMGSGVADHEVFDNLIEDRLSTALPWKSYEKVEIINFAASGIHLPNQVGMLEQRVAKFNPDIMVYCVHPGETYRSLKSFSKIPGQGFLKDYPNLLSIYEAAGIHSNEEREVTIMKLIDHQQALTEWGLNRMSSYCEAQNIIPVCWFLPILKYKEQEGIKKEAYLNLFKDHGFFVFDFEQAYEDRNKREYFVGTYDKHPNALAHQRLADVITDSLLHNSAFRQLVNEHQ